LKDRNGGFYFSYTVPTIGVEVSNPNVRVDQKSSPSKQQDSFKKASASTFSQDEIRTRAYQIYESGNRNGNHAEADWSQAETELMELVHAR
jgi:hypothetical protein